MIIKKDYILTGVYLNYYFHCPRQLWLFAKNLKCEDNSEDVKIGKLITEYTYERKKHEIEIIDNETNIVIDFIDKKRKIIHEIKKSDKMQELHIWQLKFYLFILEKNGIFGFSGEIDYPKQRKLIKVKLEENDRKIIAGAMQKIQEIIKLSQPPKQINKSYCKKCSYYEFCYC